MSRLNSIETPSGNGALVLDMVNQLPQQDYVNHRSALIIAFREVRQQTENLTAPFSAEDMQIQSMPDASPGKWHLAHTTWFFEAFILAKFENEFCWHNPLYAQLFNSYYNAMGDQFPRPDRGMISRPGLNDILDYRRVITDRMLHLTAQCPDDEFRAIAPLIVLGINHEQQHQELILTDIKHALFKTPSFPVAFDKPSGPHSCMLKLPS